MQKKFYYRAVVRYDGTGYYGFQWQQGLPTIQGELNAALAKVLGENTSCGGSSRTDTGVHALGQVIRITSETEMDCRKLERALKLVLPSQIEVVSLEESEKEFRPARDSVSKEYRYFFSNTPGVDGTSQRFIANNTFRLDPQVMKACAKLIEGKHSFHNFVSTGSNVGTTEREISLCELTVIDPGKVFSQVPLFPVPPEISSCYQFRIVGNGFLKQMIRHLMSALWKAGNGKLSVEEFHELLSGPGREDRLWRAAHPKGLFLWKIDF